MPKIIQIYLINLLTTLNPEDIALLDQKGIVMKKLAENLFYIGADK